MRITPDQFAKGSVAHSVAALLLALHETGKTAHEIREGVEVIYDVLEIAPPIVWVEGDRCCCY